MASKYSQELEIQLGGNSFITKKTKGAPEVISEFGLGNWIAEDTIISVYFRLENPGKFYLGMRLKVPESGQSVISVRLGECQSYQIDIEGEEYHDVKVGKFQHDSCGYVKIDLQGISQTGGFFADVSHLILYHTPEMEVQHVCCQDDFYFSRRGPSIHLQYNTTGIENIEYFYNEVYVPESQDVKGAFFCAIGFCGGYFGIQVNSKKERRVLFSIWSEFSTDDPEAIPDEYKVELVRKGDDVYNGEFGNEGSGAQSYLKYNWVTGQTYKFLVSAKPDEENNTVTYTAWFWADEFDKWILIASFLKPKVSHYLTGIYSFLENFLEKTGHIERMGQFGNQWALDSNGGWTEITEVAFTGDKTSEQNRKDFEGGVVENQFFLKNCGFFNNDIETGQNFTRCSNGILPSVEVNELP